MREHYIHYTYEMRQARRERRKTQTRRVIKGPIAEAIEFLSGRCDDEPATSNDLGQRWDNGQLVIWSAAYPEEGSEVVSCPYGRPGDVLYVSEPIEFIEIGGILAAIHYLDDVDDETRIVNIPERVKYPELGKWKGRTLPPEWARDRDEIVDIRIERVQDISYVDIIAEGWHARNSHGEDARDWYRNLWDSINKKRGYEWDTNPNCWVIEFKEANEDKKLRG